MASKRSVKLLAVVALAAGCDKGARSQPAQPANHTAQSVDAPPPVEPTAPAAARVQQTRAPRTLPNGRPACGNVGGKAPLPPECK
jgi:hypothetical protein